MAEMSRAGYGAVNCSVGTSEVSRREAQIAADEEAAAGSWDRLTDNKEGAAVLSETRKRP